MLLLCLPSRVELQGTSARSRASVMFTGYRGFAATHRGHGNRRLRGCVEERPKAIGVW